MSRYRRAKIEGGVLFFTLALDDRSSDLLVREIDRFRRAYVQVQRRLSKQLPSASCPIICTRFGHCPAATRTLHHARALSNPVSRVAFRRQKRVPTVKLANDLPSTATRQSEYEQRVACRAD
jgi:hypothetical protein